MALALGGAVTRLELWPAWGPSGLRFGLTAYAGLDETGALLVALAPFLAAHLHALGGTLLIPRLPAPLGKVVFFTSALLPLFDLSMLHAGLFSRSASADLGRFVEHPWPFVLLGWPVLAGLGWLAWRAFRAQWRAPLSLRADEFFALLLLVLAVPWLRFVSGLTR
jgi:hypothetical protein